MTPIIRCRSNTGKCGRVGEVVQCRRPTVGFTCRRDKQDSTARQPPNLCKSRLHAHIEGGQVQTVLARPCKSKSSKLSNSYLPLARKTLTV